MKKVADNATQKNPPAGKRLSRQADYHWAAGSEDLLDGGIDYKEGQRVNHDAVLHDKNAALIRVAIGQPRMSRRTQDLPGGNPLARLHRNGA